MKASKASQLVIIDIYEYIRYIYNIDIVAAAPIGLKHHETSQMAVVQMFEFPSLLDVQDSAPDLLVAADLEQSTSAS